VDPDQAAALARWGPGRVDVASEDRRLPVRLPDLRAVRFRTHLQHTANLRQDDVRSLAVRLETLLVSAYGGAVRPPREVALGLAVYLWSLADGLSMPPPPRPFVAACGGCHAGPGLTGPPVAAEEIGGDLALARSAERGAGQISVPSLRTVRGRRALLHDGSVPSLAALLDPGRKTTAHRFGLALSAEERRAIRAFLE
jgi:hypothetical protein